MPQSQTLRVEGLQQFLKATALAEKSVNRKVVAAFRVVGAGVKSDWAVREERFGAFTASGLKTVVRRRGVAVEQTRRKSAALTRRRPKFGRKQQLIGNRVLAENAADLMRRTEQALDAVVDIFNK